MARTSGRVFAVTVPVLICLLWGASTTGFAQLRQAPLNPEYLEWLARHPSGSPTLTTSSGHALGEIPALIAPSRYSLGVRRAFDGAPSSYDLRTITGKLPPVRNQGSSGSCWAFATYASLESCLRPADTSDCSENNLKNRHGFDPHPNTGGGHAIMSTAYLARWSGPVSESDDPYDPNSTSSPAYPPIKHVQEVHFLPANDPETLKNAVMNYGAVYANYYHDDAYYRAATYSYYHPTATTTNHAVAVVGWDNNWAASKFSPVPPGNGAWIVRNSWGTGWGQAGYFYISYHDAQFTKSMVALFHNAEPTNNYNNIYSYDPLGWVGSLGVSSNTFWGANVFTVPSNERLTAVGYYTTSGSALYDIYIYRNPTSGPVTGGTLVASMSGSQTYSGYHTTALASPVNLNSGDKFSVVVKMTTPGYNYPQASEYAVSGYSSAANASPGQSYYSSSGSSWTDLTTYNSTANFCIKAYTQSTGSLKVTIEPAGARAAGAQWRVDGGAWKNSGDTVSFLSVGNHTVNYKTVSGWDTPPDATATIVKDTQTNLTGTYVQQTGSLKVTIEPAGARAAGAQWRVDGGAWQDSGAVVSGLTVGDHTVNYKTVSGWDTPPDATATIVKDTQTDLTGTYVLSASPPTVVSITPNSGVNSGTISITDLAGTGFQDGAQVTLTRADHADIMATDELVISETQITCTFDLTGADPGQWDVVVTNPDDQFGTLPNGFTVLDADTTPPTLMKWEVLRTHGALGEFTLQIADRTHVEPRIEGLRKLRITASEPLSSATVRPGAVTIIGVRNGDRSATVESLTLEPDGVTLTLLVSTSLPDQDCYTIALANTITDAAGNPLSGDRDLQVIWLIGDANGDRIVNVGDMLAVSANRNLPVLPTRWMIDVNADGLINVGDMLTVSANRNHTAPPWP